MRHNCKKINELDKKEENIQTSGFNDNKGSKKIMELQLQNAEEEIHAYNFISSKKKNPLRMKMKQNYFQTKLRESVTSSSAVKKALKGVPWAKENDIRWKAEEQEK